LLSLIFVFIVFLIVFIILLFFFSVFIISTSHIQGPGNCTKCARLQDGLFCVSRCPQDLPGKDESRIWKYADHRKICQLCHENCTQG
jgi:hypothetical protein